MDNKRPQPESMVFSDTNNYYSQLGISPLLPTEEIKSLITKKQNEVKNSMRGKSKELVAAANDEVIYLQSILDEIGSLKNREQYDYNNPQNQVLTVQPDPYDKWLDPKGQAEFVSAVLIEELGMESDLPHPDSIALWLPMGIDERLGNYLGNYLKKL